MFIPYKNAAGNVAPWETLPAGTITPKAGMALVQSGGNLTAATGNSAPAYISMCERSSSCVAGELIPVIRVDGETIYETTNSVPFASVRRGDRVTLHDSDGLSVTAAAGGPAEVVDFDDAAAAGEGGKVYVRFPGAAAGS